MLEKKIFALSPNCRLYPAEPAENLLHIKWLVYYYIDGKRKQIKGNINQFSTVADRVKAAKALAKQVESGLLIEKQKAFESTPFSIGFNHAFAKRCKTLKPKSVSSYKTKVSAFLKFLSTNLIANPSKADVSLFFEQLPAKHANTLSVYRTTLFSLVEDMRKDGILFENVFEHIKIKKREMQPKWFFSTNQVSRLKAEMEKQKLSVLWLSCKLQHYALIRPAEMRALKVSDLFLDENKLLVRGEISKNKKREFVILPAHLTSDIEKHTHGKADNSFLLTDENGKQLGVNYLYRKFRKILIALNMDTQKHSFYSWKHTGARAWIKSGGSVYGLMRQMRHHSLDQTQMYLRKLGILEFEDDVNAMPVI